LKLTEGEPRFRINVKQSAKGVHQFDGTVEWKDRTITLPLSPEDVADTKSRGLGVELLYMMKATEEAFRKDGRKLVIDIE